jgi:hypothetical protein
MRSKILTGAAAFILATTAGFANTTPASAQNWKGNRGNVAVRAAGVVDDALATTTLPFWATGYYGYYDVYYPGYAYPPGYTYAPNYAYAPGYIYARLMDTTDTTALTIGARGATVEVHTRASGR